MNSIFIALCLVLASVQLSYQQSPASIFDAAETGVVELSNVNLAGVIILVLIHLDLLNID